MATDYYDLMNTITESALRIDFPEGFSDQPEEQATVHQPRVPVASADLTQDLNPEPTLSSAADILREYLISNRSNREAIRNTLESIFGPLSDTTLYTLCSCLSMQQSIQQSMNQSTQSMESIRSTQQQTQHIDTEQKANADMQCPSVSETETHEAKKANETITDINVKTATKTAAEVAAEIAAEITDTDTDTVDLSENYHEQISEALTEIRTYNHSDNHSDNHTEKRSVKRLKNPFLALLGKSSKEKELDTTPLSEEIFTQEQVNVIPLDNQQAETFADIDIEAKQTPDYPDDRAINDDDNPLQSISEQPFSDKNHLQLDASIDTTFTKTASTNWSFDFQYF